MSWDGVGDHEGAQEEPKGPAAFRRKVASGVDNTPNRKFLSPLCPLHPAASSAPDFINSASSRSFTVMPHDFAASTRRRRLWG